MRRRARAGRRCRGDRRALKSLDLWSRLGWRSTDVEEHQPARFAFDRCLRAARLNVRVQAADPLDGRLRFSVAAFCVERLVEDLQLLDRLGGLAGFGELVGEHQPNVVLTRAKIGKLLECLESVGVLTGTVHPVGVLEEVLFGVAVEALFGRDLTELVVDLVARRSVAENLVAEGDGVIEITALGVEVDRLLVVVDCLVGLVQPQIEVADAVVDRDVAVLLTFCLSDDLKVDLERPIKLLLLLEFGSLFFQLLDVGHVGRPGNELPGRHYLRETRVQLTYVFVGVTRRSSLPRPHTKTCPIPVWQLPDILDREQG